MLLLILSLLQIGQILKKICDHPLLLTKKGAEGILEGMDSMLNREELGMVEEMATSLANMNDNKALQLDHNVSCKINFILSLLVWNCFLSFSVSVSRFINLNPEPFLSFSAEKLG